MVLKKFAPELADVNPSANLLSVGADAAGPEFEKILKASRSFVDNYRKWCFQFRKVDLGYQDDLDILPKLD